MESIGIEKLSGIKHGIIMEGMVHSMFGLLGASLSKVAAVGLDRQRTLPRSSDMTDGEAVMVMRPSKYIYDGSV